MISLKCFFVVTYKPFTILNKQKLANKHFLKRLKKKCQKVIHFWLSSQQLDSLKDQIELKTLRGKSR